MEEEKKVKKIEFIKNKKYHFLVFEKWNPVDEEVEKKEESRPVDSYYDEEESMSMEDLNPAKTQHEIYLKNLYKFAQDNNFWDMYTLFPISEVFIENLKNQPGVEIVWLSATTPYKTRIAFGKLFDSLKVKQKIVNMAEDYVNSNSNLVEDIMYYKMKPRVS